MPMMRHIATGEIVQVSTVGGGYGSGWEAIADPMPGVPLAEQNFSGGQWVRQRVMVSPGKLLRGGTHPVPFHATAMIPVCNATALGTLALAANRLDLMPFCPMQQVTITSATIEVTTGVAASNARIGIYNSLPSGAPGALIDGSGLLDCATAAFRTWTLGAAIVVPAGGLVWLAVHGSSTQTLRAIALAALLPVAPPDSGTAIPTLKRGTASFASGLPATLPALTNTSSVAPMVRLGIA